MDQSRFNVINTDRLLPLSRVADPERGTPPEILSSYSTRQWVQTPYPHSSDTCPEYRCDARLVLCDSTSQAAHHVAQEINDGNVLNDDILFIDLELDSIEGCGWEPERVVMVNMLDRDWEDYPRGSLVLITILKGRAQQFVSC